jgi:3-methyladenine DNA glycosylase AlkD
MLADPGALAAALEARLRELGSKERAVQERRYLKSSLAHLGVAVPAIRRTALDLRRAHPGLRRSELRALVAALWGRGIHECRMAAVELLDAYADRLRASDAALLERLLRESGTWALVDNIAAPVMGPLVERFPTLGRRLDRWARDPDFWIRRSALLALLIPLREGRGDFDRFGRHADAMLDDREFFVRKAIGWVLRDTSRRRPGIVAAWLLPRAARAAPLTVREAVRHLPPRSRARILAAARAGKPRPAASGGRRQEPVRQR